MTIPLSDMKWTYRSKDENGDLMARPQYQTTPKMYHAYQKLGSTAPGIPCPKCKAFVGDGELAAKGMDRYYVVPHSCGVDLFFERV